MTGKRYNSVLKQLKKYVDMLIEGGYPCAVVNVTREGVLKTHGSRNLVEVLKAAGSELLNSSSWNDEETEHANSIQERTCIPKLDKPLRFMTLHDLRSLIPLLLQSSSGAGRIGWGKEGMTPEWWPQQVPFENVRQKPQNFEGKYSLNKIKHR